MSKITLVQLTSVQNDPSATTNINTNSDTIQTAFDNTLSRDGTSPNQMLSNLDMNGFQILNQGTVSYTVGTLPASPSVGRIAVVTDGTSGLSWGSTVTGGSSTTYLVWYNGTSWNVIGK
jgi:hypothetical protein